MGPFANCFGRPRISAELPAVDDSSEKEPKLDTEKCRHQAGWEKSDDERPAWDAPSCPFKHGTVTVTPYPGFVHGKNPAVCSSGCKPVVDLLETPKEKLVCEALEFQELYHHEKQSPKDVKARRVLEILASIDKEGTYSHTTDELEHGVRVAWRNAPKCSNRKYWSTLRLLDKRHVSTAEGMNEACLEMMDLAVSSGAAEVYVTVFRPEHPLTKQGGPRVWNLQLMRFAGYRQPDMEVKGDPSELAFTEMLTRHFGWKGEGTNFDILPLVLQPSPDKKPELFEVSPQYVPLVPLTHPNHPWFGGLGLRWYGIPCVSDMQLTLGGLKYTGAPFTGWYADTEIIRNLSDESRYNVLPIIANHLGLAVNDNSSLWKDAALLALNQAILYSWQRAGIAMTDHHTLMEQFWKWHHDEKAARGYTPTNWKWIIPPVAASTSKCYLGLSKATEYTLQPAYIRSPKFKVYAREWFGGRFEYSPGAPLRPAFLNPYVCRFLGRCKARVAAARPRAVVMYASMTGTAREFALRTSSALGSAFDVTTISIEEFSTVDLASANLLLLLISTCGSGSLPTSALKFLDWAAAHGGSPKSPVAGLRFSVFGLGSRAYPRFCAAADTVHAAARAAGGASLTSVGRGDQMGDRDSAFSHWMRRTVESFASAVKPKYERATSCVLAQLEERSPPNPSFTCRYQIVPLAGSQRIAPVADGFLTARVLTCEELLPKSPEGRSSKLIGLDLSGAPEALYEPGDHVSVLPTNNHVDRVALARFAAHFSIPLSQPFDLEPLFVDGPMGGAPPYPLPNTLWNLLTRHVALLAPVRFEALAPLSKYAGQKVQIDILAELGGDEQLFDTWNDSRQTRWLDIFDLFASLSQNLPVEVFLQLAPPIHARHYSVASSALASPGEAHLLCGKTAWSAPGGGRRTGSCSGYLTEGVQPGDDVRMQILKVSSFKLPLNSQHPVIMVAAGTGFAPLRGFLLQRSVLANRARGVGPCALLYGCRSEEEDLSRKECNTAAAAGALSFRSVAFSRDRNHPKEYVQDKLRQCAERLAPLLENPNCHVYVCGSSRMADGVAAAFRFLLGPKRFGAMASSGRYHEEVFSTMEPTGPNGT
ncbi:nitric oxide synthase [Klebsormidium nitens]|uniref:nitric-oxide synthase (NADPH) n=1 Tax=Klebsormidium nitens TaxID=105231 RepID=A0A1Y1HXQ9_KLENI|nr:nitric oxide synthase [Klebsormidium nitens]|eukprot:GAQ81306.1 nitric oxide synthase [Klebsormidium nitens]